MVQSMSSSSSSTSSNNTPHHQPPSSPSRLLRRNKKLTMNKNTHLEEKITNVKKTLTNRPKNARAMAQLSCLLIEKIAVLQRQKKGDSSSSSSSSSNDERRLRDEAINLSKRSIEIAKHKSFSHWSLSRASIDGNERFSSLIASITIAITTAKKPCSSSSSMASPASTQRQQQQQQNQQHDHLKHAVFIVGALVRLLVEPRDEERRTWRQTKSKKSQAGMTSSLSIHPSRRCLNEHEERLILAIESRLVVAWTGERPEGCSSSDGADDDDDDDDLLLQLLKSYRVPSLPNAAASSAETAAGHDNIPSSSSISSIRHLKIDQLRSISPNLTRNQIDYLSLIEYRLGVFFRKMTPSHCYRPLSRNHFERVVTVQSSFDNNNESATDDGTAETTTMALYHKASFWLATFHHDDDDDDDDDDDNNNNNTLSSSSSFLPLPKITKCPEDYVISLYSTFAERFDELLVQKLNYRTPHLLRRLVDNVIDTKRRRHPSQLTSSPTLLYPRGVDLGCGTGLSGLAFRNLIDNFIGVDLSPEMIAKAKDRSGCYDDLSVNDIESYLKQQRGGNSSGKELSSSSSCVGGCWDIVLSCDVFVYIGDLGGVFREVRRLLTAENGGGLFAFSTEWMAETTMMMTADGSPPPAAATTSNDDDDDGYALRACARFAHKESYVRRVAQECGFVVLAWDVTVIRRNNGKDVKGILAVLGINE